MIYSCKYVLADFGVAKADIEYNKTEQLFKTSLKNTVLGTYNYMAPELINLAEENIRYTSNDPYKCDIFSLGLVIIECCTLPLLTI